MPTPPEILSTQITAKSRLFEIETRKLRFSNGTIVNYELLRGRAEGAVLVVPINEQNEVLLVCEYAGGVHRYEIACPKGLIDPGETHLEAADRELKEEIGFGARQLTLLDTLTIAPGYLDHHTHIILAQDLYPCQLEGDEPEEIEVVHWPFDDLSELIQRQDFTEARSIAALFMAREYLAHE